MPPIAQPQTIFEAVQIVRQGNLKSSLSLLEAAYEKLDSLRYLNAFNFIQPLPHLIKKLEKSPPSNLNSPLFPLPIAIKDNFCVKGIPATCSSQMLHSFIPPYTATVVKKLEDAGGVVISKTNMDEFGMGTATVDSVFGPTKNIWGLEEFRLPSSIDSFTDWRVPGGSSGGSAVAVASGICFAALGSDTGGSTRNPSSYCGVVGLKPTYGLLSRHGLIPLVNSMDVPGIITRTVEDAALILNIVKGFDENDSTSLEEELPSVEISSDFDVSRLHIGIPSEFLTENVSSDVVACWKEVQMLLESAGAKVSQVSLPHTKYSIACYSVLNPCEVASNMGRYDGLRYGHRASQPTTNSTESLYAKSRHEGFNDVVRGRILAGNYFLLKENYDKYFLQALKVRRLISEDFKKVWRSGVDLLLTPVTLSPAPKYSDFRKLDNRTQSSLQDFCTQSANMAGIPALSLPIKLNSQGLPLSLQILGPELSESKILNLGRFIEKKVQFPHFQFLQRK